MIRTLKILVFCALYATILPLVPVWAQETITVTAEGVADIPKNAMDIARHSALEDAQKRAMEQVIGILVDPQVRIDHYQLISDRILSKNKVYIERYHVIGETIDSGLLRVRISAEVSLRRLSNDLTSIGIALGQMQKHRSIVLIAEQNIRQEWCAWWCNPTGSRIDAGTVEKTLVDIFAQKSFEFIDHGTASKKFNITAAYCAHDLTAIQARALGNEVDAEIVIVGKALSTPGGETGKGLKSVAANLSLMAVRTDTGQIIAATITNASVIHKSEDIAGIEALKKASQAAAGEMISKILAVYSTESEGTRSINITIHGLNKMQFAKFKDLLSSRMIYFKDLHERSFNGTTARLSAESTVSIQKLSDALAHSDFGTFDVEVTGSTASSLELKVTSR